MFPIISKLRHLYLTHIDIPILSLVGASVSILSLVGASVSILSLVGASVSIHILLTSCWFEVQGKHSSSCSRPPPEPSISTGAWNLGEKEGRGYILTIISKIRCYNDNTYRWSQAC